MTSGSVRLLAPSGWSVEVPDGFQQKDNGDSWQAYNSDGSRVVYIASLDISGPQGQPSADQIVERAMTDAEGVIHFRSEDVVGRARVSSQEHTWVVTGVSAIAGRVATTTISVTVEADVPWAVEAWRSIRFDGQKASGKRRWLGRRK